MTNNRNIYLQELLDSDDELPNDFNEAADIPAYLRDGRFDASELDLTIKNPKKQIICTGLEDNIEKPREKPTDVKDIQLEENSHLNFLKSKQNVGHIKIKNGVLREVDVFCIKSIRNVVGSSTVLWFLEFLMFKDLQSDYAYLRSCLVSE